MRTALFSAPLLLTALLFSVPFATEAGADEVYRCGRVYTNRSCPTGNRRPVTGTFSRATANSAEVRARLNPQAFGMGLPSGTAGERRTRTISPSVQQDRPRNIGELSKEAARLRDETPEIQRREGTVRAQT